MKKYIRFCEHLNLNSRVTDPTLNWKEECSRQMLHMKVKKIIHMPPTSESGKM